LNIREKIAERLDSLQLMMESQEHLRNPELVTEKLEAISKFWSALSEEEREYISSVRIALNEGIEWKKNAAQNL
jgi:hypothetical protein